MNKKSEENIAKYPTHIDTKVALLEQSIAHINETLIRIEKNISEVKTEVSEIRRDMKYDFRFLVTAICGLAAVMAHGFHWF